MIDDLCFVPDNDIMYSISDASDSIQVKIQTETIIMAEDTEQTLSYTDAQKIVELDFDGKLEKFSIYDALTMMSKEDYESSLPAEEKENIDKKEEPILVMNEIMYILVIMAVLDMY